jgi:hypothetical protein
MWQPGVHFGVILPLFADRRLRNLSGGNWMLVAAHTVRCVVVDRCTLSGLPVLCLPCELLLALPSRALCPELRVLVDPTALWPRVVTWLILPVVICLSQRLSHACLSISKLYGETANGSLNQLSFI